MFGMKKSTFFFRNSAKAFLFLISCLDESTVLLKSNYANWRIKGEKE